MGRQFLKLFCKVLLSILIIIISTQFVAAQTDVKQKKQEPVVPDDETIMKWIKNHPINDELSKITCDWPTMENLFNDYMRYFGESWEEVAKNHKCEEVLQFCMEKERKRWTHELDIITPEKGIDTGNLILYGHYIKPPYKIDINYGKKQISINNVLLGSVFVNRVEQPPLPKTEERLAFRTFVKFTRELRKTERELKPEYMKYIQILIKQWSKELTHEKVLEKLKSKLEKHKETHRIGDYFIYDEKKLLFDVKFYYSWDYWEMPLEYSITPEELARQKKEFPEIFLPPEERKKYEEEQSKKSLEFDEESYTKRLNDDSLIMIESGGPGEIRGFVKNYKNVFVTLLSEYSDYQKIVYIEKITLGVQGEYAKEIVFNSNKSDYLYLIKKLIKLGKFRVKSVQ